MKNKILGVLCIFMMQNIIFSQDTAIVKYLPLKVGNVWVYKWIRPIPDSGIVKISITGTVNANGHTYYQFQQNGTPCACPGAQTYSPFLWQINNPIRIDSSTGNIFWRSIDCGWHFGELLFDSLKMRPDSICGYVSNGCFYLSSFDTNIVMIFCSYYPSKNVGRSSYYSSYRRYAKGIGLISSSQYGMYQDYCSYILKGCLLTA